MSNRTIMEFNHDFLSEIERRPDEFVRILKNILRRGTIEKHRDEMSAFGVTITPTMHHSDERILKTPYEEYRF